MKTLEYLQTHSLDDLCNEFHIVAKRHGEFPNLVQLKYSQIESPMGEPIVQECRGLILDEADNWRVVCRPYSKFFNYGEGHAAPIDWSTARVYEKLDGSLMSMYEYRGQWHVASSGLPDAAGPVHTFQGTFRDLFWRVWDQLGYHTPNITECRDLCFMFELMTPHNRVIVPQHDHRLVLHGIRNRVTGEEFDPSRIFGWDVVKRFPLDSIENCIAAANALNPMESEGYVVEVKPRLPSQVKPGDLCDRNGVPIYPGDLIRTDHFKDRTCRGRMRYLWHMVTNRGGVLRMTPISMLANGKDQGGECYLHSLADNDGVLPLSEVMNHLNQVYCDGEHPCSYPDERPRRRDVAAGNVATAL